MSAHAFTVERVGFDEHLWTCQCGWKATQRGGPIYDQLIGHAATPLSALDLIDGNSVVDLADKKLRSWAANPTREDATRRLSYWEHYGELTAHEVEAVLRRFD